MNLIGWKLMIPAWESQEKPDGFEYYMKKFLRIICFLVLMVIALSVEVKAESSQRKPFFSKERNFQLIFKEEILGFGRNFSGITRIPETGNYFVIDDLENNILEFQIEGATVTYQRTIELQGFHDIEAIGYVRPLGGGNYQIAVAEEQRGTFALFSVGPKIDLVDYHSDCEIFFIDDVSTFMRKNSGIESLCVDHTSSDPIVYYFAKEEFPRKIYRGIIDGNKLKITIPWDADELFPHGGDIADLFYFRDNLFVLDERKDAIRQVDPENGDIISRFQLPPSGYHKYEGLSIYDRGNGTLEMIIVAEDHEILIYEVREL